MREFILSRLLVLAGALAFPAAALALAEDTVEFYEDGGDRPLLADRGTAADAGGLDDADLDLQYSDDPFDPGYPSIYCAACRDAFARSVDFGNLAWNLTWGPNGSLDIWRALAPGGMLKLLNPAGQTVYVWFTGFVHVLGLTTNTMTINVRLPNGQVLAYAVLQTGVELPVGDQAGDDGAGNEGSDGADDPDWTDDDGSDDTVEPPDLPRGTVEIVDPDDYGEYPDWWEEL